jgi:hypothetical protein
MFQNHYMLLASEIKMGMMLMQLGALLLILITVHFRSSPAYIL